MNFAVCLIQGILFSVLYLVITKRQPRWGLPLMVLFTGILIGSVYFLYREQDEAVWPFFVHPYLTFLMVDLADFYVNHKSRFEKLLLWPFFILPAMSGFVLCCGWVLNIGALKELFNAG